MLLQWVSVDLTLTGVFIWFSGGGHQDLGGKDDVWVLEVPFSL
jgi:hypothetical protein